MDENTNKSFYKTPRGVLLLLVALPVVITVFVLKLWFKASRTIWQKDWKKRYRVGGIVALWSLFLIIPSFLPTQPKTLGATTEKAEVKAKVEQQPSITQTTSTSAPINTPTPTTTPIPTNTPVPTVIIVPTKKYVAPTPTPTVYIPPTQSTTTNSAPATNTGSSGYSGGDKDCGDFSSHAEAQSFFISQGGPASDPHRLDGDNDGSACETLP